ncbi:TrmH family RNA methyltransferase [Paenibacillus alkalitolerans]|uniref:TrmH family RNA methyltransferase n=1 Tax=Paenibacillus alkalitolerans TaxID=2799335 RepID=UPI0018F6A745|nr:RNA methyltransferase [Paenibacillus alkalitolerans]
MDEGIRSLNNEQVKQWAALQTKKGRDKSGTFLIEGAHVVGEAFHSGAKVDTILYIPGSPAVRELGGSGLGFGPEQQSGGARWVPVSDAVMAKVADAQTPQGVAAVVKMPDYGFEPLLAAAQNGLFVAVDAVQDPGNLGTIIRSADAVGATAVLVGKGSADVYNPKTVRSTMGSLFHVPVVPCNLADVLPIARSSGVKVIAASLGATHTCFDADYAGAVCFLVGNEGAGVSAELLAMADETVIIPIPGRAESLNVAMAATVLLYETVRQRLVYNTKK